MRTFLLILATLSVVAKVCAAQVQVYYFPSEGGFPAYYEVVGDQLQHHSISFRSSPTMQGPVSSWEEFAFWGCTEDAQTVSATKRVTSPQMFFRTINSNCGGNAPLLPAPAPAQEAPCEAAFKELLCPFDP